MRNLKSIFIGLLLALVFLLLSAIAISYFYEDEVSQYLVEELNENLLAKVEVEDIHFTLLKKFPKATVEFKNVIAYSKEGYYTKIKGYNTDTLFFAKNLYIQINFLDFITNEVKINSIQFDQGEINLFVDHLGDANYIFWNQNTEERKELNLDLNEVKVTRSKVLYCNN